MKSENKQNQKGGTRNVSNSNTRPASSSPNSPVGDNTVKNPDEWTTGEEPMTGAQHSYLKTLSHEAGEEFNDRLTKAEASKKIDELQHKTGRGLHPDSHKGRKKVGFNSPAAYSAGLFCIRFFFTMLFTFSKPFVLLIMCIKKRCCKMQAGRITSLFY